MDANDDFYDKELNLNCFYMHTIFGQKCPKPDIVLFGHSRKKERQKSGKRSACRIISLCKKRNPTAMLPQPACLGLFIYEVRLTFFKLEIWTLMMISMANNSI